MASSLTVSRQACGKIFLHAAKYFESQLIGYVIGSEVNGQLTVSDVLSVCHTNPAGPILELAGDVADTMFGQSSRIVGIYYASDNVNNEGPSPVVQRTIDNVTQHLGKDAIVLKVCNKLLSSKEKLFLEASRGKTQLKIDLSDSISFVSSLLDALLIQKIQPLYVDFEDHMNSSADTTDGGKGAADFRNVIATNFIANYTVSTK